MTPSPLNLNSSTVLSSLSKDGLAFKVDVDTYRGLQYGVPALLNLFRETKIRASFFVSLGPDHSGRAVFRIFTKKGFLKKMIRTRAARMYGFSTLLYGTLLPAPKIAHALPHIIRAIPEAGHEIGIHCWDHVKWQDKLHRMSIEQIRKELNLARSAFREVLGRDALSSAAPGWISNARSLAVQDQAGLIYCSDMRGESPFFPVVDGVRFNTLQIPTTLPTMDEIMGEEAGSDREIADYYLSRLKPGRLHVMTVHAETEGMGKKEVFRRIIEGVQGRLPILMLSETARLCLEQPSNVPHCEVLYGPVPGRAGDLSIQGERIQGNETARTLRGDPGL